MKKFWKLFLIVSALVGPAPGLAEPVSAPLPKSIDFWKLVGKSYLILEGTPAIPVEEIRKAAQEGEHEFVVVSLKVQKPLKGDPGASVLDFRYYTDTERYGGVTRRQILAFDGRPVIVFLQRVRGKYYLAVYSPDAMQKANEGLAARVKAEVERQERLIQESDHYAANHVLPKESEVQSLVELMVSEHIDPAGAQEVYDATISLGKEAVPAIVKYMDDRRRLTYPKITLEPYGPDAFEGLIHYGPDLVVDVMTVILSAITEEDLTSIYNSGTELQRKEAVRIWKVYERRTFGRPGRP